VVRLRERIEELVMKITCRLGCGILGVVLCSMSVGNTATAQTASPTPAPTPPPSSAPAATASATTKPKKPAVADIMPTKSVEFDFEGTSVTDILKFLGKSFDLQVENAFETELSDRLTFRTSFTAQGAIDMLNTGIQPKGYSIVESVRMEDAGPKVVLTVLQIKKDAGNLVPVYTGMDPAAIPEGSELRTQVMVVKNVNLEKYRETISAVLGKEASININAETKTLIVTDTGTHIHTLASLLQVLDKAPAEK